VGKLGLPRASSEINKTEIDISYKGIGGVTEYEVENTEVIREYENLQRELNEDEEEDVNRRLQAAVFQDRDYSDFVKGDQVRYFLFNAATQK
jgi:CRISPR/Cas system-associated protein Cas10 (large subunit of type III CRISPR-Cas system)